MVNTDTSTEKNSDVQWGETVRRNNGRDRIWTGILLVIIGGVALARSMDVPMPPWLFTWQALLVALGILTAIRHRFDGATWFIMLLIGSAFLVNDYFFDINLRKRLWPLILICIGVFFILRSRFRRPTLKLPSITGNNEKKRTLRGESNFADITVIFGSSRKSLVTPNFAGGDITTIFGGAELNLMDSDIQETAMIDLTTICGGIELIVPSNWTIKSNLTSILASIDDKRILSPTESVDPKKILILEGTAMFAGIEIKSFGK